MGLVMIYILALFPCKQLKQRIRGWWVKLIQLTHSNRLYRSLESGLISFITPLRTEQIKKISKLSFKQLLWRKSPGPLQTPSLERYPIWRISKDLYWSCHCLLRCKELLRYYELSSCRLFSRNSIFTSLDLFMWFETGRCTAHDCPISFLVFN